ncbi:hypothetical protein, partial [Pantoea agglomerans]|uniref:hypothetical protein n=1 Tax=Enterobacter agglomerans TaxID=549 RepID=UPI002B1E3AAD
PLVGAQNKEQPPETSQNDKSTQQGQPQGIAQNDKSTQQGQPEGIAQNDKSTQQGQPQGIAPTDSNTTPPTMPPLTIPKNKAIGDMMDAYKSITTV